MKRLWVLTILPLAGAAALLALGFGRTQASSSRLPVAASSPEDPPSPVEQRLESQEQPDSAVHRRLLWLAPFLAARLRRAGRLRRFGGLVVAAVLLTSWFLTLAPTSIGGPATVLLVSGTSMQPTLETGDLVVLQRRPEYNVGDVVAFRVPEGSPGAGALVIHRVVGGSVERYTMQGDNKPEPDEWRPTAAEIQGILWLRLPGVGHVTATLRSPPMLASLSAGAAVFLVLAGGGMPDSDSRRGTKGGPL